MKKLLLCASAFALMLGSCSKDDTEVAPVEVKGKVAFSAVLPVGGENETRTHLNEKGQYVWDDGDMLGASVMGGTEVVPFVADPNAEAGQTRVDFLVVDNDLDYLGAGPYYVAYPYDKTVAVAGSADAPTMKMTIPASQRYRANSFATMTAPAVGVVQGDPEKDGYYNPGVSEVTLHAACSYIRIPVKGAGSLTELKLQIQKASSSDLYVLNGAGDVAFAEGDNQYVLDLNGVGSTATPENNYVKISFGAKGLDLKYVEEANLLFVVPAHIPLRGSVIKYEAIVDGKSQTGAYNAIPDDYTEKLPRNMILPMSAIELGMEDKVLIENNADLLEYLYAVSKGLGEEKVPDYVIDGKFKTAVLAGALNFNRYDARNDINGADEVMQAALTEYMTNGSAINSIAEGAKIDGNGHIISNLQVKGNGIFAGKPDALKNLTLSAVTVNVPDEANPALFVGNINLASCSEGLAIKGGYLKNVAEDATAALIHTAYLTTLPSKDKVTISYPRVNESSGADAYYASKLVLQDNVDVDVDGDLKAYFNSAKRRFGAIVAGGGKDVAISNVSSAYVSGLLDAIQYGGGSKAISVIDSKGTSYWTGGVASEAPANGVVKTAEQLAYVVKNGGRKLTLANNIDLQGTEGKVWTVGAVTVSLDGASKTIKDVNIVADSKLNSGNGYYSLLGNTVTATNLNVSDVTIDVQSVAGHKAYIGGLGVKGSANSVVVNGLTIKVGENVVAGSASIGGLISTLSKSSEGNNASRISIDVKSTKFTAVAGMFGTVGSPKYIFSNNTVTYLDGTTAYPMVDTWTINDDAEVAECSNVAAAIVKKVKFNPTEAGQIISLTYDCPEPFCDYLVNTKGYNIAVDINGKVRSLTPGENPFENEE